MKHSIRLDSQLGPLGTKGHFAVFLLGLSTSWFYEFGELKAEGLGFRAIWIQV